MRLLILLLLLCSTAEARIARDHKALRLFRAAHPCPATGLSTPRCPGWIIDHVIPLCAGGPDKPSNMAWQTVADAKVKDRAERKLCASERASSPVAKSKHPAT